MYASVENVIETAVGLSDGEWSADGDIAFDGADSPASGFYERPIARAARDFERIYISTS
jgi:hypothetical protein